MRSVAKRVAVVTVVTALGLPPAAALGSFAIAAGPGAPAAVHSPEQVSPLLVPWPVLRQGSNTHAVVTPVAAVKSLQLLLRARGFPIAADGAFGPQTDRAVRAFQKAQRLAVDGVVGPATWSHLITTVRRGSIGDAVRGVQVQFQARNLSGNPALGLQVDGIFGPKTDASVRGFQHATGQRVDGIVGPVTWENLVGGALAG